MPFYMYIHLHFTYLRTYVFIYILTVTVCSGVSKIGGVIDCYWLICSLLRCSCVQRSLCCSITFFSTPSIRSTSFSCPPASRLLKSRSVSVTTTIPVESAPFFVLLTPSSSRSLSYLFSSLCMHHFITAFTFDLTIYHSLSLLLQT